MAQGVCCFIFSYFPLLTCFYFVSYLIKYLTRGVCVGGLDPIVWNNQNKMGSRVHWHPSPFLWRRLIMFTLSLASVLIIWKQLFFYTTPNIAVRKGFLFDLKDDLEVLHLEYHCLLNCDLKNLHFWYYRLPKSLSNI